MRVVSWNVEHCGAGVERVADVLRALDPEVAMLMEVDRGQEKALGRLLERHAVKGRVAWWRDFGNALLLRAPPTQVRRIRLTRSRGAQRRAMVVATLGSGVTVAATHLGLTPDERTAHAKQVMDALPVAGRVILGADLNEGPGGPAGRLLVSRFTDAFASLGERDGFTYPASLPVRRIDYVFCSRDLIPERAAVAPFAASDHLPLVVDLRVPGNPLS